MYCYILTVCENTVMKSIHLHFIMLNIVCLKWFPPCLATEFSFGFPLSSKKSSHGCQEKRKEGSEKSRSKALGTSFFIVSVFL